MKIYDLLNPEPKTPTEGVAAAAPKNIGILDMVIAFDTTGSMAQYIEDVRRQVTDLIPQLFDDNEDLRLGIVAFGDYCDMDNAQEFGKAYQYIFPTNNRKALVQFVKNSRNTSGGDGDEFYELVIKKIVEETPWREEASRTVLLIADANPHPLGYCYRDYVDNNKIDWREEARKAAELGIKIDTVSIHGQPWYRELSEMTNGINVPFSSSNKTAQLVRASVWAEGSESSRSKFDDFCACIGDDDMEMRSVASSFMERRKKSYKSPDSSK